MFAFCPLLMGSYNFLDFYVHATVKNALASDRKLYTDSEPVNLKRFILNAGYTFGDAEQILWEPSFMFQLVTLTQEKTVDLNIKAYKDLDFGRLWGGLSYRRSLDGAQYVQGNGGSLRLADINTVQYVPQDVKNAATLSKFQHGGTQGKTQMGGI